MKKSIALNNDIITRFSPSETEGLTLDEVASRKNQGLINTTKKKYSKSYFSIITGNLFTFFNLLGLIVCLALLYAQASIGNFFFVIIFSCNILIGIIQEIRAKICIDRLSLVAKKKITVIRGGQKVQVFVNEIVLDDIIELGLGNQIPTDCILLSGNIDVNESLLTGESDAIKKSVGDLLLAGSFITSGVCTVRAERVGKENYVETLSEKAKKYKKPQSEIMRSMQFFIKVIGIIIIPITLFAMLKSTLVEDLTVKQAIISNSTIVIGMIPAGMFLLTSLALAVGIIKLARHNTLVQDLYSLEMLARVNTICFDKTGTITDGKMTVQKVIPLVENYTQPLNDVLSSMLGAINDTNQTALALNEYFGQNKVYNEKEIFPFNSTKKLCAVTFDEIGTYSFGAPEFVLSKDKYNIIKDKIEEYAGQGLRVLVVGHSNEQIKDDQVPEDFNAIALLLIADNIREDAIKTIAWFKENGVAVKVISGDNPLTVSEVSKRVGIENADKYISLDGLSDEEVSEIANEYTVFGRVTPEQKAILIKAIKAQGNTTAMTGDGVNDILALKEADCAITVASGSEATRNICHLVLMDNNFNSMPKVVYEGRRVINNVTGSASIYLMKTFFTMTLALITLIFSIYKTYPFKLQQMIMLEVFIIGTPTFFLALQENDKKIEGKFIASVIAQAIPSSVIMLFNVLLVYMYKAVINPSISAEMFSTMNVYALTFAGVISLYFICRPLNKYRFVLFFTNLLCILGITLYASIFGFSLLGLVKISPLSEYYGNFLYIIALIIVDAPILFYLKKLFNKIKIKKLPKFLEIK